MAKIDMIKESIGYFKVIFGILVAIDISIIGWLFRYYDHISNSKIVYASFSIMFITLGVIYINKKILEKIDSLEEL